MNITYSFSQFPMLPGRDPAVGELLLPLSGHAGRVQNEEVGFDFRGRTSQGSAAAGRRCPHCGNT